MTEKSPSKDTTLSDDEGDDVFRPIDKENTPPAPLGIPDAINRNKPVEFVDEEHVLPAATAPAHLEVDNGKSPINSSGKQSEVVQRTDAYSGVHIPSNASLTNRKRQANVSQPLTEDDFKRIAREAVHEAMSEYATSLEKNTQTLVEMTKQQNVSNKSGFETVIVMSRNAQATAASTHAALNNYIASLTPEGSIAGSTTNSIPPPANTLNFTVTPKPVIDAPPVAAGTVAPQPVIDAPPVAVAMQSSQQKKATVRKCTYCKSEKHIGSQCPVYPDGLARLRLLFDEQRCGACGRTSDFNRNKCQNSRVRCATCPIDEPRAFHMPSACQYRHPPKQHTQQKAFASGPAPLPSPPPPPPVVPNVAPPPFAQQYGYAPRIEKPFLLPVPEYKPVVD